MIKVNTTKLGGNLTDNQIAIVNTAVSSIATALNDADLVARSSQIVKDTVMLTVPLVDLISRELHQSIDFNSKYAIQRELAKKIEGAGSVVFNIDVSAKYDDDDRYERRCNDTLNFTLPNVQI